MAKALRARNAPHLVFRRDAPTAQQVGSKGHLSGGNMLGAGKWCPCSVGWRPGLSSSGCLPRRLGLCSQPAGLAYGPLAAFYAAHHLMSSPRLPVALMQQELEDIFAQLDEEAAADTAAAGAVVDGGAAGGAGEQRRG